MVKIYEGGKVKTRKRPEREGVVVGSKTGNRWKVRFNDGSEDYFSSTQLKCYDDAPANSRKQTGTILDARRTRIEQLSQGE